MIALKVTGKRLRCQYWDHKIEGKDMCKEKDDSFSILDYI